LLIHLRQQGASRVAAASWRASHTQRNSAVQQALPRGQRLRKLNPLTKQSAGIRP
jgi:hypothetical protein